MSDLLISLSQASLLGVVGIGFTAGLAGSLHCVGMCGAFATSCGTKKEGLYAYHTGKLLSYALLGLLVGFIGSSFSALFQNHYLKILPSLMMGLFFIFLGWRSWKEGAAKVRLPQFLERLSQKLLLATLSLEMPKLKSFSMGFLSAFLPCGLLYGVLLSFAILQNPLFGMAGMASFGVGTIPALTIGPSLLIRFLGPLRKNWPRLSSLSLISLGLLTISYRMVVAYGQASCH